MTGVTSVHGTSRSHDVTAVAAPTVSPSGFTLDESSLTDSEANFTWNAVDDTPENIRGFFRGYQVRASLRHARQRHIM